MPEAVPTSWDYTWSGTGGGVAVGARGAAGALLGFISDPIGSVVGGLLGAREDDEPRQDAVRLDIESGLVDVGGVPSTATPDPAAAALRGPQRRTRVRQVVTEQRRQIAASLADAFAGRPFTVPAQYQQIAEDIAGIGRAERPPPEPPFVDEQDLPSAAYGGEQLTPPGPEEYFVPRFVAGRHLSIPGGEAGMRQMPTAVLTGIGVSSPRRPRVHRRRALARAHATWATRSRRRTARLARTGRVQHIKGKAKRRRTKGKGRPSRMVKGSAAAKRHMARLRAMQKRR